MRKTEALPRSLAERREDQDIEAFPSMCACVRAAELPGKMLMSMTVRVSV